MNGTIPILIFLSYLGVEYFLYETTKGIFNIKRVNKTLVVELKLYWRKYIMDMFTPL